MPTKKRDRCFFRLDISAIANENKQNSFFLSLAVMLTSREFLVTSAKKKRLDVFSSHLVEYDYPSNVVVSTRWAIFLFLFISFFHLIALRRTMPVKKQGLDSRSPPEFRCLLSIASEQ